MFFCSSNTEKARTVGMLISSRYGIKEITEPGDAEPSVILALGGDGFMLDILRKTINTQIHVYGINCGNAGFLLNKFHPDRLLEDIKTAKISLLPALTVELSDQEGSKAADSINDFYLFRSQGKASKLGIIVDGEVLTENFIGDGVIVSTPVGSAAYNAAAGGPLLELSSHCIVLTGINSCGPKQFRSLVLPEESVIEIEVHSPEKRPVMGASDAQLFHGITKAKIFLEKEKTVSVLFAENESLQKKTIRARFYQ